MDKVWVFGYVFYYRCVGCYNLFVGLFVIKVRFGLFDWKWWRIFFIVVDIWLGWIKVRDGYEFVVYKFFCFVWKFYIYCVCEFSEGILVFCKIRELEWILGGCFVGLVGVIIVLFCFVIMDVYCLVCGFLEVVCCFGVVVFFLSLWFK